MKKIVVLAVVLGWLVVAPKTEASSTCVTHCPQEGCVMGQGIGLEINAGAPNANKDVEIIAEFCVTGSCAEVLKQYTLPLKRTLDSNGLGAFSFTLPGKDGDSLNWINVCLYKSDFKDPTDKCRPSDSDYICTASISTFNAFDPKCDGGGKYVDKNGDRTGIDTALGCLPTDPEVFVGLVLPWAAGIGGGVAFLLMLYGVFMIIISSGVPDKMQAGKELISSAITGLLIIIFAVFILRFIGVDVLGLFS